MKENQSFGLCYVKVLVPKLYIPWTRDVFCNESWIISWISSITFCSPPTEDKLQALSFFELSFLFTDPVDSTFHFVPSTILYKLASSWHPPFSDSCRSFSPSVSWEIASRDLSSCCDDAEIYAWYNINIKWTLKN